ncbi:penicillin-binding protein 2 [Candidatus Microgenomates bacterium]|nr:penicillin-binding protein 2 [Candidatus Microgenomates bacterium]
MGKRLILVFVGILCFFVLIIIRLFFWQVANIEKLRGIAENQTNTFLTIPAKRGEILATDGSPLVMNKRAYLVYLEPHKIENKDKTVEILAKELGLPSASISAKLKETELRWLPIAQKIDEEAVAKIKKFGLPGIGFIEESKRYYPEGSMSAHLLGFVGKNAKGEDQGYSGLEGYYEEQLHGRNGYLKQETDARGNPILSGNLEEVQPEDGRDLVLTIDKTVQFIAEKKLLEGIEKYGAKGGTVAIMDPYSGSLLASASYPSYDPGDFLKYPSQYYINPVVASSYEPGSTFKVLVMAAALNEGKVKPDTKINEDGPITIGEYTINTWNQKYHGEISLNQILEYSSNVGMVLVQKQLGSDLLLKYLNNLGFGRLTDIDLEGENSPLLRSKSNWYEIDYASASFGQGIAVTPLQMVRAVGAIANGGRLMKPYVVKSIKDKNNRVINISEKTEREVYKKEATTLLTEMMVSAVDNGETRLIKPQGYKIAGKTGTAQIAIAGHYDAEKTIASFVGFAPVRKPKFVMLVTIQEPTASPWGSETAAPVFFSIAKELFSYYGISPD